jgi:uncharacterized membrane protein
MINELLESKKFWMMVVGLVIIATNRYGLELDADQLFGVALTIVGYLTGQGLADFSKEKQP